MPSPSSQRMPTSSSNNRYFPIGNVFDIDPYDTDRLITCSPTHARFYRLSINNEDSKLQIPTTTTANFLQNSEATLPNSCVHWNKESDVCMTANTKGIIQLYRRINRPDV